MGGGLARLGVAAAVALLAACVPETEAPFSQDPVTAIDSATNAPDGSLDFVSPPQAEVLLGDAAQDAIAGAQEVAPGADAVSPEAWMPDAPWADGQAADGATAPAGPTAGVCFAGLPAAATSTGSVPMPSAQFLCPALQAPEWFVDQPVPPPSLQVLVGQRDAAGVWHPLADGDWVPLGTMMQGGFHLDLVPRVTVPGQSDVKLLVQLDAFAVTGCAVVASVTLSKAWLVQAPGPDFVYTTDPTAKTFVVFADSATKIKNSCGIWLKVVWRVRLSGTAQWGETVRTLRTYDGSGLAGGVATAP